MVPEQCVKTCTYQVCQMVPEQRVKTCTYKVCHMVHGMLHEDLHSVQGLQDGARAVRQAGAVHGLQAGVLHEDDQLRRSCVPKQVPYTVTRCVPVVVCKQVPVKVAARWPAQVECCEAPACPAPACCGPASCGQLKARRTCLPSWLRGRRPGLALSGGLALQGRAAVVSWRRYFVWAVPFTCAGWRGEDTDRHSGYNASFVSRAEGPAFAQPRASPWGTRTDRDYSAQRANRSPNGWPVGTA